MRNSETICTDDSKPEKASRAPLAAAFFLAGAIALVNPAMAGECENMADLVRAAARDNSLSEEGMREIENVIEKAMRRLAHGDEQGCLSELSLAREALKL